MSGEDVLIEMVLRFSEKPLLQQSLVEAVADRMATIMLAWDVMERHPEWVMCLRQQIRDIAGDQDYGKFTNALERFVCEYPVATGVDV